MGILLCCTLPVVSPALAALPLYTQRCPNGDTIDVDMRTKSFVLHHEGRAYHATYDDSFAYL